MGKRVAKEDFLKKAIAVHGERFDYSDTVYINSSTPIEYRCKNHGIVSQLPHNHYRYGCKQCANEDASLRNRNSTEIFIKNAIEVHQDKYDYSFVKYKNSKTKVEIVCKRHSKSWLQIPDSHLRGNGCPLCGGTMKSDTDSFIEKARKIHGIKRYDYSESVYTHAHCKLTIICGEHEEAVRFVQTATDHLSGYGCPRCAAEKRGEALKMTNEEFINRAKAVWGDKFSYEKTIYDGGNNRIVVTCVEHGDIETLPHTHLKGAAGGCNACGRRQTIEKQKFTTDEFKEKAFAVHGERYCYDNTFYDGANNDIVIECREHGEYTQRAAEHLQGAGCPICNPCGGFDREKPGIIYYLKISHELGTFYKIGITNKTVETRFRPAELRMIEIVRTWSFQDGNEAYITEQLILKECSELIAGVDGILYSGNTEIFSCDIFA